MARLLSWVHGLVPVAYQALTGPRAVGASATESNSGFVQTTSSAFGGWRWQFTLRPMRGKLLRRYRHIVMALHGGSNAIRVPFCDLDIMSWEDSAVTISDSQARNGVPFTNNKPFSNGKNWGPGRPKVAVSASAAVGDTTITLSNQHWRNNLVGGEMIGFLPDHKGMYTITEKIDASTFRIWPPLRKAITTAEKAHLRPVVVMRLESEAAGTLSRGRVLAEGNTLTMVEVQDPDVREYFAD